MIWLRRNLFRSVGDSLITIVVGLVAGYSLYRLGRYVFVTGRWQIVQDNLALYLHKVWPEDQLWRLVVTLLVLAALGGALSGLAVRWSVEEESGSDADANPSGPGPSPATFFVDLARRSWAIVVAGILLIMLSQTSGPLLVGLGVVAAVIVGHLIGRRLPISMAMAVFAAALVGLGLLWLLLASPAPGPEVADEGIFSPIDDWGGAMLNVFLAVFSISLCFPIGVLAALGRRSELPVVRFLATIYIEGFRGVPLFVLLLMANVALGFFVPQSLAPSKAIRAIVVFTVFTSAYVAEIVRGGLQSVPKGQVEAGRALGLSPVAVTRRIVLPQALRNVIPALVGQFISLFKDTTLAGAAMGFTDLTQSALASTSQGAFRGQRLLPEALAFVMLLFWAGSYTMSNESQRLERRLTPGGQR